MIRKIKFFDFLVIIYFIFSLIYVNTEVVEDAVNNTLPIVVPFIESSYPFGLYFQFVLSFIIFIIAIYKNKARIKFDYFAVFLLYRFVTMVFQVFFISFTNDSIIRTGNYFIYFVELLFYIGLLNYKYDWSSFSFIIKIFSICVSIETIYQALNGVLPKVPYTSTWYKACIRIPIGASNTLAVIIVPVIAMIVFSKSQKNIIDNICVIIGTLAVVLTKSRIGIAFLIITYLYLVIMLFLSKQRKKVILAICIITIFLGLGGYYIKQNIDDLITIALGYSSVINSDSWLNNITSGRTDGLAWYFNQFFKHPLIGCGPNFVKSRAHIIIVDLLYQNGLIGLILFIYSVIGFCKKSKSNIMLKEQYIMVVFILINSLFEISYFTFFIIDIFLFVSFSTISKENGELL